MSSAPRDENREAGLVAKSDADNTPVVIEADAATKRLKVSAVITSGGSGGTQYTDGDAAITHPIGTIPVYNNAGTITAVSVANPLPVSATISTAGLSTSANQTTEIASLATIASLSKAEDAPHSSGDTGVPVWAVRNDAGAVFAGSDGDYIPLATDATGALRVDLNGTLSTNNSTTAVLAGNAAFTGTSEDALNYNEIRISVITSHVSATDGLSIQQSEDNTNWDFTDTYTIPAATGKTYSIPRQARYFRVVYTNGATLQTFFRLQTILNRLGARVSSQRANDTYTNETDLEQQQSFLMGYNGSTWDRIRTKGTGVVSTDTTTINNVTPLMGNGVTGTGSQRVTVASDNTPFAIKIDQTTPGTTNAVSAVGGFLEKTGTATSLNADVITSTDVSSYKWMSLQLTGTWSATVGFQGSNDNVNWIDTGLQILNQALSASLVTSAGSNNIYVGPVSFRFFRARATSYSSGTVVGTAEFYANPTAVTASSNSVISVLQGGAVSSGGSDFFAPLKIGGRAQGSPPTAVTDGQIANAWFLLNGALATTPIAAATGGWSFTNISTSTTTTVKSGAGTFHLCSINTLGTVASTCTFYDNTAGSGTIIAIINSLTLSGSFTYDIAFATGLTVVTTGTAAPNITVAYK